DSLDISIKEPDLDIYNLKGQLVSRLVNETQSAGNHSVVWDGRDSQGKSVASGFYFYRIKAAGEQLSRKILLMK
ncbi:MAG TPA: FlgD immunoglobulin-like domain containing protein, partial [Candidatus Cloacimonadota bacterium]|nr:FlgD immunoglobulin-like domain containing protein [Candidatus Cloacimonadota bacterium]